MHIRMTQKNLAHIKKHKKQTNFIRSHREKDHNILMLQGI